ncbi:MAG TPA: thioredoxin [Tepidisphaeraceae bacterium]|nr:thioredoxin [Tepidisphaeraceae bacterium]
MAVATCSKCGAKNRVDPARSGKAVCGKCGTPLVVAGGSVPVNITDAGFESAVLSGGVVLVDCWAPWCGPCRMIAPVLEELAGESAGRYVVAKLNVDENPMTAQRYQISSIPTMLLFNKGQLVDRIVGLQQKNALAARLAAYL